MLRHDPTAWPRKDHYAWFRALAFPWTAVTAELDATAALERAQAAGVGAFAALAHAASAAANAVPELRQRIRIEDGRDVVVEHAVVHAGLTLAGAGDLFTYAHEPFHLFVLPSYATEGLPMSILEAMAARRAIVTTRAPGNTETVDEGVNGFLVPQRDPAALAAALRRYVPG